MGYKMRNFLKTSVVLLALNLSVSNAAEGKRSCLKQGRRQGSTSEGCPLTSTSGLWHMCAHTHTPLGDLCTFGINTTALHRRNVISHVSGWGWVILEASAVDDRDWLVFA